MENLLKKQSENLNELEKDSKQDKLIQAAALLITKKSLDENKAINDDGDRIENKLSQLNEVSENSRKQLVDIYKKILEQNSLIKSMAVLLKPSIATNEASALPGVAEDSSKSFISAEEKEFRLEETSLMEEQNSLLREIAENTRGMGMGGAPEPMPIQEDRPGIFSKAKTFLAGKAAAVGGAVAGAGGALGRAALARPGLAAGLTVGATTALGGYLGYKRAGREESAANAEIDAQVARGEISEEQAQELKQESANTATVGRSEAVGKGVVGTGGALLGAKGGAIAGAKLGSFLGPKGAVVGGLVGAGVGAVAGSQVGKDIGGFAGRTAGKVKNFSRNLFSSKPTSTNENTDDASDDSGKTEAASIQIKFSEPTFRKNDPENYEIFRAERDGLIEKYAKARFENYKARGGRARTEPSSQDYSFAKLKASQEVIPKYKKEIEAAGAGSVTVTGDSNKVTKDMALAGTKESRKPESADNEEMLDPEASLVLGANDTPNITESTRKPELANDESQTNARFSEKEFSQNDPENYAKFRVERDALVDKKAKENFERYKARGGRARTEPSSQDYSSARLSANAELLPKYKNQIEAAGAGSVNVTSPSGASNVMPAAAKSDSTAVEKKSSEADSAKTSAMKPDSGGNTIVAPSTTVNNNQSKVSIKTPIRNQESSQSQYLRNRYIS